MKKDPIISQIIQFIKGIGINVRTTQLETETFLPGVLIENGELLIDFEKLKYPGDLLHEAGHIALEESEKRINLSGDAGGGGESLEIGVLLWTYAAARHLEIKPEIVFHENGYKGQAKWLIENFEQGSYIGLPLLQWMGLSAKDSDDPEKEGFPNMIRWTR